ncbi:hypothetical protein CHARACLAT_009867 [Characodon lateralis]|uniref:Secreted protein n=1 Tax=Characodon lateralis TaxID=208331 RepID=A0ABU7E8U1_9TELE|nr:hypothetical protein [Characodon lateralis]
MFMFMKVFLVLVQTFTGQFSTFCWHRGGPWSGYISSQRFNSPASQFQMFSQVASPYAALVVGSRMEKEVQHRAMFSSGIVAVTPPSWDWLKIAQRCALWGILPV